MIINAKYFGLIAEITNKKEEQLEVQENQFSVKSLQSIMEINYPDFKKTTYSIAVNQVLVGTETILNEQDTIAFLPPFAGG